MYKSVTLSMLLAVIFFACQKENEQLLTEKSFTILNSEEIIGSWKNPVYYDSLVSFTRSDNLADNEYGFSFQQNKQFIERKNSGWCGTPPISYADYTGTWDTSDSLVTIQVPFWGGKEKYIWQLVSVDDVFLKIIWIERTVTETLYNK